MGQLRSGGHRHGQGASNGEESHSPRSLDRPRKCNSIQPIYDLEPLGHADARAPDPDEALQDGESDPGSQHSPWPSQEPCGQPSVGERGSQTLPEEPISHRPQMAAQALLEA